MSTFPRSDTRRIPVGRGAPALPDHEPSAAGLTEACFSADYPSARAQFQLAAARAGARLDIFTHPTASAVDGGTLTIDVAVLGPADADRGILIISGTHGPEAFVGSAAQIALLNWFAASANKPSLRVVLVHAMNPWGFSHTSRTNENNVDLNRNFIDWTGGTPGNPAYDALHPWFCPSEWSSELLNELNQKRESWIAREGIDAYIDMASRGQYDHPTGLHYGGRGPAWSNITLETVIIRHLRGVSKIALIDWHAGLGRRADPFFLCFNERGSAAWERACEWWGRERIESQAGYEGAARPAYQGLLFQGVQRFASGSEVTGAVIEFGTLEIAEVQLALQGDYYLRFGGVISSEIKIQLQERLLEAFAPASLHWRKTVLAHAIRIQHEALEGLTKWD